MIVELIAHTVVTGWGAMRDAGWEQYESDTNTDEGPFADEVDRWLDHDYLAEFAGRLCYQSWNRPNPDTATNDGYLANILKQRHFSVLEHSSATFYVAGVSRSLSHELVRHRFLSFSQLSQRFVDESSVEMVTPPAIAAQDALGAHATKFAFNRAGDHAAGHYEEIAQTLLRAGLSRKQAREAARAVLPNATETRFVVTGNLRAWRDVLERRLSPAADAEIRELAQKILAELKIIAPNAFQDFAKPEDYTL